MGRVRQINPNAKYYPPRLLDKLEFVRSYPFTLIEAPSGFGKTTLLEYFFEEQIPRSVPRSTYDFESDEPLHIWKQICRRIGEVDPECGEKLRRYGPPDEDNISEIHEALQALDCPSEAYLWLDNYKRWNNSFSGEFLSHLARHGGKNLHVIVSSQPLPPDTRARANLTAGCWQMTDEDLVFRPEDIGAYFSAAGISLSGAQIRQASELTEGWIMALCLQMLCYLEHGEFEQGGMTTLMEHAFWDRLSPREQDFLLKISIFPRFTLGQATALSQLSSGEIDRVLRDKRYFIHFDPENRFFYPHSQLKILLQEHFSCLPQEQQREIYLQGGEVARQAKDRLNTLRFYYSAGAWERILEMPLSSYELADVMQAEVHPIILDILSLTPMEIKLRHPRAILSMAFCLFIIGETGKLAELREEILEIIRNSDLPAGEKDSLEGEYELLISFLEYNRISDMSRHHRRALELLGGPARLISPRSIWTFGSPSILYLYWRKAGGLDEELAEMDECMPVYYKLSNGHGSGAELIMRAEAHLMRGETDDALPLCYQALFVATQNRQDSVYQCGLFTLCRLAFLRGSTEEVEETLNSMHDLAERHREDLSRYTYDLAAGYMSVIRGKPDNISPWLAAGDISDKRLVMMVQPLAHIIYGRCLLLRKEYHKLLGVSQYFLGLSSVFPNLLTQVYTHIYCAVALDALGKGADALSHLQSAADLAMPDRICLPFAEMYRSIRFLLPAVLMPLEERERIEALAAVSCGPEPEEEEPFTPREKEILALLREGLTNKEIGARMSLSPNTVRNAVSAMLRKRKVETRQQLSRLTE